jgi:glycerol-3-phosphate cytidylyltransferase
VASACVIGSHQRKKGAQMVNVITFGTFDLFHIGHLRLLERARTLGDKLVVGVSSDDLNFKKKNHRPIFNEQDRKKIVSSLRCVDTVFTEDSLELKRDYIVTYQAKLLVMGDDWRGKFDELKDICEVRYLTRTPDISTTNIKLEVFQNILGKGENHV